MTTDVRWGILGTGNMARAFARDLRSVKDAMLVAVGSRSADSAHDFAREFGATHAYGSYEDLAADADVDLVYVATPHHLHAANSIMCLNAGRSVLCEKPFAINSGEAEAVFAAAGQANRFLMEAMWTRMLPVTEHLRAMLAEDRIGKLSLLRAGGGFMPPYDPQSYLFDPARGGGVLLDAGVYLVHLAVMLLGAPDSVRAIGHIGAHGVDDQIGLLLGYDGGILADLHVSLRMKARPKAVLYGEKGSIHIHGPIFCPSALTISLYDGDSETIPFATQAGYAFQAREAMRCLRLGLLESPVMPWDETRRVMNVMDEARRQIGLVYPMEQTT